MYKGIKTSVYIPCYNEEKGLGPTLESIPDFVDEVVVVDNNSTDKSAQIAQSKGAEVVKETVQGYGAAHKRGSQSVSGDIICTGDADGTYPFRQLPQILDFMLEQNLDFVSASRFPLSDPSTMTKISKLGNFLLTFFTKLLFGYSLKDSQSGMWCYRKEVLPKLKATSNGMPYSQEIKIEAIRHPQVKLGETHINYQPRLGEIKLSPWKDGVKNLLYLFRQRFNLR